MDIVYLAACALFTALIWAMTSACAKLGERK
jgi:hypothetical protein